MIQGEGGYVRDYRSTVNWEWFTDVNTAHLWEYIRLRVNYEPSRFRGMVIQRGEMIESISTMAVRTGLTPRKVRTALDHLKSTGEVTCKPTRYGMLICAVKYAFFQGGIDSSDTQIDTEMTQNRQEDDTQTTTYKESKKVKKKKNSSNTESFTPPTADEIREYAESEQLQLDIERFLHFNEKKGWIEHDWKYSVRSWCKKEQEFQKSRPKKKDELSDWYDANPKRSSGSGEKLSADELKAAQEKLKRMRGGQ